MKKSKRLLSLFLVLVLVAALMPVFAVGALADGTVIDGETVYGSETRREKILQFDKTRNGHSIASGYRVDVDQNRYVVKYGRNLDYLDWGYQDTTYWLIPQGNGIVDFTIERTQALHAGSTDVNRWWRWSSWVNDTAWRDDGFNGMYAHIDGTKNDDHLPIVKSNTTRNCIINLTRGDYYTWTGGGVNRANFAVVKVDSDNLAVGTTGVLRSANGTKDGSEIAQSWVSNGWIRAGDQGVHNIIIAEEKDVVYDLNGGNISGDTNDQRYVCWSTGNKSSSQLHDVVAGPVKEGYVFAGWKCVENDGAADPKVGSVYQTSVNHNDSFAVVSNVKFEAVWDVVFNIAHVQDGEVVKTDEVVFPQGEPYNFVEQSTEGFLYGGTFTDIEFSKDTIASNDPTAIVPEAGRTYYISEVSDENLRPKTLATWSRNAGVYDVKDVYLFCAVNSLNYKQVGFTVNGHDILGTKDGQVAYEYLILWTDPDTLYTYNALCSTDSAATANAYIACRRVDNFKNGATFVPYWITLDGMKVTGTVSRTFSYNGEGKAEENKRLDFTEEQIGSSVTRVPTVALSRPMKLMAVYSAGRKEEPAVIEEPIDTPDVPDIPDIPDVPDEPEVKAVLNVVDGENAYELEISESMVLTPAGESGKLFAGWFADKAFTVPADISAVSDGDTVYAKYVSEKYLQVKYSFGLLTKTLSVTSAVDSKDYAETGFIISTKGGDKTVVVSKYAGSFALQNAKQLFGVEKTAALMNIDYKLSGLSRNDKVTVTPYLVTADGTTVYGTARTLTFNGLTMKG